MDTGRRVLLVGLGVVLFVALLSSNLIVAADRTALDSEFAKDAAEEGNLHGAIADEMRNDLREGVTEETSDWDAEGREEAAREIDEEPFERSVEELFGDAITEEYVRTQTEANIDRTYAYLHGEEDELHIVVDTVPIKERMVETVAEETESIDLRAVAVPDGEAIEEMAESEAAFDRHRAAFRAEQKARIQAETEREYSDEELAEMLDEEMDEIRERLHEEVRAKLDETFAEGDAPAALEEPIRDLSAARIDALTDALDYEAYAAEVDESKDDLGDAFLAAFETELDEGIPDAIDLTEEMDEESTESLEAVRDVVSALSALAVGLPVATLVVAGAIAWVAPASLAALIVGAVSALVGALGVAASRLALGRLESFLAAELPPETADLALGVAAGVLGTLTSQSAGLLLVGIGLLGATFFNGGLGRFAPSTPAKKGRR